MLRSTRASFRSVLRRSLTGGLFGCCLVAFNPVFTAAQDRNNGAVREWIDNTGNHRVEAAFVAIEGNQVVLKRKDGKEIKIPFDRLNADSLAQAKSMAASAAKMPSGKASKGKSSPSSSRSESRSDRPSESDTASASVTAIPDNLSAQAFVDFVMGEIQKKNAMVLWDAMPSGMQKDVESLVATFAKRIDSRTFDMIRKTRNSIFDIARKQQSFVLNSTVLPIPPDQKPMIQQAYPAIVNMLDSYVAKELFDAKRLQKGDLRPMIVTWTTNIAASAEELGKALPEGHPIRAQLMDYSGAQYTVENISSSEAELKLQAPNPAGPPQEVNFILKLSDGRWLPKEMVDGWESNLSQARTEVQKIEGEQVHAMVSSVLLVLNAPLNNLKNAKTQAEFDQVLTDIMGMARGLSMGQMGGGPGGPGGFGGPGGPPGGPGGFPPGGQLGNGQGGNQNPPSGNNNSGAGKINADQ